jgi:hypothetical protein
LASLGSEVANPICASLRPCEAPATGHAAAPIIAGSGRWGVRPDWAGAAENERRE